jgi:hypothetical protein
LIYFFNIGDLRMASCVSPGKYKIVSWSGFILEMYSSSEVRVSGSSVE